MPQPARVWNLLRIPKIQRQQLDLAYLIAEPNQTKAQPVKNTPLHVPMIDTANSVTPKPSYRGGNDKLLPKILLGFVCLAILGHEIKATNIPTGNATISGNATTVYVTGGQYNNGSLTITSSGAIRTDEPFVAFSAYFNGAGFNAYTLNNYGQISAEGLSPNSVSLIASQGNTGQFNFNNYGNITLDQSSAANNAAVLIDGVTIPTFFNAESAQITASLPRHSNYNSTEGAIYIKSNAEINEFINYGQIIGPNETYAAGITVDGSINTLTNFGVISAGSYGIYTDGSIQTLNNFQGPHSEISGILASASFNYWQVWHQFYNVIIH